jgi:hypothetical protein
MSELLYSYFSWMAYAYTHKYVNEYIFVSAP